MFDLLLLFVIINLLFLVGFIYRDTLSGPLTKYTIRFWIVLIVLFCSKVCWFIAITLFWGILIPDEEESLYYDLYGIFFVVTNLISSIYITWYYHDCISKNYTQYKLCYWFLCPILLFCVLSFLFVWIIMVGVLVGIIPDEELRIHTEFCWEQPCHRDCWPVWGRGCYIDNNGKAMYRMHGS